MKEFKKWTNKKPNEWDGQRKDVAKIAWRAALNQILVEMKNDINKRNLELEDFIKEELKDE